MSPPDIPARLAESRGFFASGRTLPPSYRIAALRRLRDVVHDREEALYAALQADLAKPRFEALAGEVSGILGELDHAIAHLLRWARPRSRRNPWLLFPGRAEVRPEPYGTVLIVAPWNFPLDLALSPLVGAVAAGNTVLIKPSELAPASSALLAEIVRDAFEPGHVSVVEGGVETAEALLEQRFDYLFFTGGEAVGRRVMQAAARHLTPVTLELGGKSPVLVAADADLDLAARRILFGRAYNAGQACVAPDYVLVERSAYEPFLGALRREHARLFPEFPSPDRARIVNCRHFDRLLAYLEEGRVLCGGRHDAASLCVEPTVLVDVPPAARVMQDEIFGPILPVVPVPDLDSAIHFVQERPRPLALYLFTRDARRREDVLARTTSGGVTINDTLSHYVNRHLPFGGIGPSGLGRYHHQATFETFSHFRGVQTAATRPDIPLKYPPYAGKFGLLRWIVRHFH